MLQFAAAADSCGLRVVALLLLAGVASRARVCAQTSEPLQLTWQAPASCPDADAVRARVRALAGASTAAGAQLRAAATVTQRSDGQYQLKLFIHMDQLVGERNLEARSCEALAGATAVNLALLLEEPKPLAASEQASPPSEPAPKPAAAAVPAGPLEPEAPAHDASHSDLRAILQLPRLLFGFGPLPAPSVGLSLAGGARLSAWTFIAGASFWLPHTQASDRTDANVRLQRVTASLSACRSFNFGRIAVAPCATMSLEHLSAQGVGAYIRSAPADATWLAAGAGVQARFRVARWLDAFGGAELKLQAARPRISIAGLGQVAQLGPVAAELLFGVEWIL